MSAPIIVKRIKRVAHEGHHGGAWKIAYADFVTAMMAFFLLMWLLGSVNKEKLAGISEYFQTPLKVALFGGDSTGDSTSLIKGGGVDPTRSVGHDNELNSVESNPDPATATLTSASPADAATQQAAAAEQQFQELELAQLQELKQTLASAIEADASLAPFREQIRLDETSEGLRIQVVDARQRPMFASGSARMEPYMTGILRAIGGILNKTPNRIGLSGHTDASPYSGGDSGYSNWELSSDRANTSRRELIAGGMHEEKVIRVVGLGSAIPLLADDPQHPSNRRISILVMNRHAEQALQQFAGSHIDVQTPHDLTSAKLPAAATTPATGMPPTAIPAQRPSTGQH